MKIRSLITVLSIAAFLPALAQDTPAKTSEKDAKKNSLLSKIETELGKPLESEKAAQLKADLKATRAKVRDAQEKFADSIAATAKVSKDKIEDILPSAKAGANRVTKDFIPKLEKAAGRKLEETEVAAVQKAQEIRRSTIEPAQQELETKIISLTGLAKEKVEKLLRGGETE